jgi:hypothetical protein
MNAVNTINGIAIHADVIPGIDRTDPCLLLDKLHGSRGVEVHEQWNRQRKRNDRHGERQPAAHHNTAIAEPKQHNAAGYRQPNQYAQNGPVQRHYSFSSMGLGLGA